MFEYALILAGGLGTRLRPLTHAVPKPLLPVGDKPILERIIENMKKQGIKKFFLSVNYKKDMIKNYFKNGKSLDVEIEYLEEKDFTGTAGCLSLLPSNFNSDIVVSNGDLLVDVKYNKIYDLLEGSDFVITVVKKKYKINFGVLNYDIKTKILENWVEKPTYYYNINAGIYGISMNALNYIKNNIDKNTYIDMPELWSLLINNNYKIKVYEHNGEWNDIGKLEDYIKINEVYNRIGGEK